MAAILTPTQRIILWHMTNTEERHCACTGHLARKLGFGAFPSQQGGLVFRAYGDPLHFLRARGLMECVHRNAKGRWYVLTDAGRAAAPKTEPPTPQANPRSTFGKY